MQALFCQLHFRLTWTGLKLCEPAAIDAAADAARGAHRVAALDSNAPVGGGELRVVPELEIARGLLSVLSIGLSSSYSYNDVYSCLYM